MREANTSNPLMVAGAIAIGVTALCFSLLGGNAGHRVRAGKGVTTETAAAAAGAKVLPTDPELQINLK